MKSADSTPVSTSPLNMRKGIYLLPNLLTLSAFFSGFYAIIASTKGAFEAASVSLFIAMLLDCLDGRVARMTQSQSAFGAQLDSLSDLVCFGLTPALVLYQYALQSLGKIGWLVAFFYAIATALRLARFNAQAQTENKKHFQGLPTPAAAGTVSGMLWFFIEYPISLQLQTALLFTLCILLSLLKVSTLRYRSFKDIDALKKVSFFTIFSLAMGITLISFDPPLMLMSIFFLYSLTGPADTLWRLYRIRQQKKKPHV